MSNINITTKSNEMYSVIHISVNDPLLLGDIQNHYTNLLKVIIDDDKNIFIDTIINWDWFNIKRIEEVSRIKWFLMKEKEKAGKILKKETENDGTTIVDNVDENWHVLLGIGKDKQKIRKYFQGYGEGVVHPDIIYVGSDILQVQNNLNQIRSRVFLDGIEKLDDDIIKKALAIFSMMILGFAGSLYVIVSSNCEEKLVNKINNF